MPIPKFLRPKARVLSALVVGIFASTAHADDAKTVRVPLSQGVDSSGTPSYVDDAAIKDALPGLAQAGARRSTCANSQMDPPHLFLAYGPVVSGPHAARMTYVWCEFETQESERTREGFVGCDAPRVENVGFIDDPARYFGWYDVDPAQAQSIAADFFAGRIDYDAGVTRVEPNIRNISIDKLDGHLTVRWGDCGCSNVLRVQLRDKAPLLATRFYVNCI